MGLSYRCNGPRLLLEVLWRSCGCKAQRARLERVLLHWCANVLQGFGRADRSQHWPTSQNLEHARVHYGRSSLDAREIYAGLTCVAVCCDGADHHLCNYAADIVPLPAVVSEEVGSMEAWRD